MLILKNPLAEVLKIEVVVEPSSIKEGLPSGDKNCKYDEQTIEDWYDFASTIEGMIENFCSVENISLSKHENSLSEYIDFYSYDESGNKKNYLVNLRLSDHKATTTARQLRKKRVSKLDTNYVLKSVIVNGKTYSSYEEAIKEIRKLIVTDFIK